MKNKRRVRWLLIAGIIAVCAGAVYIWSSGEARAARALQGAWVSEDGTRVTFSENLVVLEHERFSETRKMFFRLDPFARPRRITTWDSNDPSSNQRRAFLGLDLGMKARKPEQESRGIYELNGDHLRICFPNMGGDFPGTFEPEPGGGLFDLRRQ